MTEQEWNKCKRSDPMLKYLRGKASDRKLRLFVCGCCRQVWKDLTLKPVRRAVEVSEQFADGHATEQELDKAHGKGVVAYTNSLQRNVMKMGDTAFRTKMNRMALAMDLAPALLQSDRLGRVGRDETFKALGPTLLRCIFGNPFRPVTLDLAWVTPTVQKLAAGIYDERAFDRMPILGDGLEEAGCTDQEVLRHCRQPGEHVKGCWVVDLVLGKE